MGKLNTDDCRTTRDASEKNSALQSNNFDSKKISRRYTAFVLICLLAFGLQFCYDNPGALQDKFRNDLQMSASEFAALYSVYSWPNVILCFIGGFLLDGVFGIRLGTIVYATLTFGGQLLFAMGTYMNIFWLMILGRFVFGIGSESLIVAQKSYAVRWFKGDTLSAVLAIQIGISQLSAALNSISIESTYKFVSDTFDANGSECIGIVLFATAITCAISMICALFLGYLDSNAEKNSKQDQRKQIEVIKFKDVQNFGMTFWLTVLIGASYCTAVIPFVSFGKLYFMTKYKLQPDAANTAISLSYSITAVFSPFVGVVIDRTKQNMLGLIVSIVGASIAHCLLAFTHVSPYICMVSLGIFDSFYGSSYWSMIALIIPENQIGTAYGIVASLVNLNLAAMTIVCGIIVDNYGYFMLELFYLSWLSISFVPAIVIWISSLKSINKT